MSGLISIFCIIFVPALAMLTNQAVQQNLDAKWKKTIGDRIQQQVPEAKLGSEQLQSFAPSLLCSDQTGVARNDVLESFCNRFDNFMLLDALALFSAGFGLLTLMFIVIAGKFGAMGTGALRYNFRLALWLTRFAASSKLLLDTFLALATFYFGQSILADEINLYSFAAVGFLVGVVVLKNIAVAFFDFRPKPFKVPGKLIKLSEHPKLQEFVNDVFTSCESQLPNNVVVGVDFIFFTSDVRVDCRKAKLSGRTLFLPLPLCRLLNRQELKALIAHDLFHLTKKEIRVTRHFYVRYEAVLQDLDTFAHSPIRFLVFPITSLMNFLTATFAPAEVAISRQRELKADRFSAEKVGREPLATALIKLYAFTATWDYVEEQMRGFLAEGKQIINSSEFFATLATITETAVFLKHIALSTISHPTDRHPLLGERLGCLKFTIQDFAEKVLGPKAQEALMEPAIYLFENHAALEADLTNLDHLRHPHPGQPVPPEVVKLFEPSLSDAPEEHDREIA